MNLECQNCEVRQRQFYCKSCLKTHLRDFHSQHTHFTTDLKAVIATAQSSLQSTIEPARVGRARVAEIQARVEQLVGGLTLARKDCEKKRDRIRKLREDLAQRRRTLGAAKMLVFSPSTAPPIPPSSPPRTPKSTSPIPSPPGSPEPPSGAPPSLLATLTSPILAYAAGALTTPNSGVPFLHTPLPGTFPNAPAPPYPWLAHTPNTPQAEAVSPSYFPAPTPTFSHSTLTTTPIPPSPSYSTLLTTLTRARIGLIQELVDVFHLVETNTRPTITHRNTSTNGIILKGTRGEWTIGSNGLILPVPGDIRRYPPEHINAVLTLTLHFLNLLSFYLGVRLPFEVVWGGGKVGLGVPWIGAIKGVPTTEGLDSGNGSWARWYTKHPLHLSNSPQSAQPPPLPPLSNPIEIPPGSISASPTSSSASSSSPLSYMNRHSTSKVPSTLHPLSTSSKPLDNALQSPTTPTAHRRRSESPTVISPPSTPTTPSTVGKRTSLFGLAKGVVGYAVSSGVSAAGAAAGRARTLSLTSGVTTPSSSSSRTSSRTGSPTRPSHLGGEFAENETRKREEAELEASMINALPLPAARRPKGSSRSSTTRTSSTRGVGSDGSKGKGKDRDGGGKEEGAPSFTIALAMLIYNVAYLGHTQGVDIPLHQSGEILSNLWRVCCSPDVGRFGHETGGYLASTLPSSSSYPSSSYPSSTSPYPSTTSPSYPSSTPTPHSASSTALSQGATRGSGDVTPTQQQHPATFLPSSSGDDATSTLQQQMQPTHTLARLAPPTPPSFTMDFGQVLQVISTAGHRDLRAKARVVSVRKGTSVDGAGSARTTGSGEKGTGRDGVVRVGSMIEEEDEFDMIDEASDASLSMKDGENEEGKGGRKAGGNEEWDLVDGEEEDSDGF